MSVAKGEATLNRKFVEMMKLLNVYLNHFPRFEKFALCNNIRNTAYRVYDLIVECQKKYYKKTSLSALELSHWHIQKIKKGINFVGYRTWKSAKFVRKHSLYKFRKAVLKKNVAAIISIIGHAIGTKSLRYLRNIIEKFMPNYIKKLPNRSVICLSF